MFPESNGHNNPAHVGHNNHSGAARAARRHDGRHRVQPAETAAEQDILCVST